ncbi:MAG: hypothetical protein CMK70_02875 [Pseudohongiella sp.]|nr:hypothetical protein [Pseudohongiella sp.]
MNIQIRKLIIWPRDDSFPPREVTFELNKLNVITGASRTGKSAIIPIIDYCLGSGKCSIPIDTIRDHASWYGVVLQNDNEQILIARKVPSGNESSNEFYYFRASRIDVPNILTNSNSSLADIKQNLNELASLPFFSLDTNEEGQNGFKARLSFRDLMAFVFQTQDIVANQNILFYKTHAHEHREKLRNWFPYILGAETIEVLQARQRVQVLERQLGILRRELEKERTISDSWRSNLLGHLKTAADYGLLDHDFDADLEPDALLAIARELLVRSPDNPDVSEEKILKSNSRLSQLEEDFNVIATDIAHIKKRLEELDKLKAGFSGYGAVVKRKTERLHLSRWLTDMTDGAPSCPVCGEEGHHTARAEMSKICSVLEEYEREASKFQTIPSSFEREESKLKEDLEEKLAQRRNLQERYDWNLSNDKQAQREFYKHKEMYIFLGHFKASLERFEKLLESGELEAQIEKLETEYQNLRLLVDGEAIRRKVNAATSNISQIMLSYLQELDVEEKYRSRSPEVNIKELAIRVMGSEGDWHFLAEVGSASNWVAFHIAAMCAFQEYFASLPHSSVPSFVIFDQPSQVYFPKVRINPDPEKKEQDFKDFDEDFEAVQKIFAALSKSVSKDGACWQFIVLDHADSDIYGKLTNIKEVDVWRDGRKLIPPEWYGQ